MTGDRPRRLRTAAVVAVVAALGLALGATGCMERLFYLPTSGPTDPPPGLEAETVWFESADGTRLHGWFLPAAGPPDGGGAPAILFVHGNAGNLEGHVGFVEHLPAEGFSVLCFDYRGYGRSEGRARRRGPLLEDAEAALDALLARPDVDPARIGLYGQSLGGAIGLNLMARRDEIAAAVVESAFASWREAAASALGGDPPNPIARGLAWLLIRDGDRPDDAIARIDRPILLLHGGSDRTIPVSHGRRLAAAGPTARLVEGPGGDHNDLRWTHPQLDAEMIAFFRTELSADPPAP